MLQPFPSFLDVSQSFAGQMRDERWVEISGVVVVVSSELPDEGETLRSDRTGSVRNDRGL
jgi:hypothetical protein